ncbi:ABC transporter ATP-binding protein [Pacificispira sp.]|uniref:ABC transporter ATP-binding protein n=1 Tax=Pacificispira sp. TaxID=2888761 RepID=UPI002E9F0192|nr:ABC transporter ATP-binding protein [Pseudomonadota bacterium]
MLEVENLGVAYGRSKVLHSISLTVGAGEVVTLMGRNGMGKSTTVMSILGLKDKLHGNVRFDGKDITGLPAHRVAGLGIGLVPEGRRVFPNLTVEENLLATRRPGPWDLNRVHGLFPRLSERARNMGNQLSGGEQQMLAIGRALMLNPRLLILDEATEGLAPVVREEIWSSLETLKREGQSILVIDKHIDRLRQLANRHYVVEKGRIAWSGDTTALAAERDKVEILISV